MKKGDLKKAYCHVPQSFHNKVQKTLDSLEEIKNTSAENSVVMPFKDFEGGEVITVQPKRKSFLRAAAVCSLAVIVGVAGVIWLKPAFPMYGVDNINIINQKKPGATDTSSVAVSTDDQPALEKTKADVGEFSINLLQSENAPEYVKMSINYLPEGVTEDQGKYSLNGNHEEMCFTIVGSRVVGSDRFSDINIIDMEELDINGNLAFLANVAVDPFSRRFYIFFEDMAVFVEGYVTKDVSDDELRKVMDNITIEECTAEESNLSSLELAKLNKEAEEDMEQYIEENAEFKYTENFYEVSIGQIINFNKSLDYSGLNYTVDKVEVLDNISHLDYKNFGSEWMDIYEIVDERGEFIEYERDVYDYSREEPFKTVVKTEKSTRCLVYATVTFNNTSDIKKEFELAHFGIVRCKNNNGSIEAYNESAGADISELLSYEINYCDNERIDDDGYYMGFYYLAVPPKSSKTVHIGFLEDKKQLENMYLFMNENYTGANVNFDPKTYSFVPTSADNYCSYACIKVQ